MHCRNRTLNRRNSRPIQRFVVAVVLVLAGCGSSEVAESVERLQSEEAAVRQSGARQLAEMKGERTESIPTLIHSLDDADSDVRRLSAAALGRQGASASEAVSALIERLSREDEQSVQLAIAYAIVQIDPTRLEPLGVLMDSVRRREVGSIVKLQQMGPAAKDAVPLLTEVLRDSRSLIRLQAVQALEAIGPDAKSALPALKRLQNDRDESVRDSAVSAVRSIEQSSVK